MPVLKNASAVYLGDTEVAKIYAGETLVYESADNSPRGQLLATSLAWLKLDETSGTVAVNQQGGDGTYVNVDPQTAKAAGAMASTKTAILFDGSDQKITMPDSYTLSDWSIAFAFKPTEQKQGYINDFTPGFRLSPLVDFQFGRYNFNSGGYPTGNSNDSSIEYSGFGVWDYVTWTKSGSTLKGYLNGVERVSVTIANVSNFELTGATLLIADSQTGSDDTPSATLDDWALFDRTLTPEEVITLADTLYNPTPGPTELKAFPGAEGFGSNSVGGRGGTVYHVTNLNDAGGGSLRSGIEGTTGPRTIVFDVAGQIELSTGLDFADHTGSDGTAWDNITIAGHTAPGEGITLVGAVGHNIFRFGNWSNNLNRHFANAVIRGIRIRKGPPTTDGSKQDCVSIEAAASDIIFDHCTFSWASDECVSTYGSNVTFQWCLFDNPLIEDRYVDNAPDHGGYGVMLRGTNGPQSLHHCLFISCQERMPRTISDYTCDIVNNLIYNAGGNNTWGPIYSGGATTGQPNVVSNIHKVGPGTWGEPLNCIIAADSNNAIYVQNNVTPIRTQWDDPDQVTGVVRASDVGLVTGTPNAVPSWAAVTTTPNPYDIEQQILDTAGASYGLDANGNRFSRRDSIDTAAVQHYRDGTMAYPGGDPGQYGGMYMDDGDFNSGDPYNNPPFTTLAPGTKYTDTDLDGMPDAWETAQGTDPNVADNNGDSGVAGYTNLEAFLGELNRA